MCDSFYYYLYFLQLKQNLPQFQGFPESLPSNLVSRLEAVHSLQSEGVFVSSAESQFISWGNLRTTKNITFKPEDLPLIQKFVCRMKGSEHKIVYSQIFQKTGKSWAFIMSAGKDISEPYSFLSYDHDAIQSVKFTYSHKYKDVRR